MTHESVDTGDQEIPDRVDGCQHPDCDGPAEVVGVVTVGDMPLGPLFVCEDHDGVV